MSALDDFIAQLQGQQQQDGEPPQAPPDPQPASASPIGDFFAQLQQAGGQLGQLGNHGNPLAAEQPAAQDIFQSLQQAAGHLGQLGNHGPPPGMPTAAQFAAEQQQQLASMNALQRPEARPDVLQKLFDEGRITYIEYVNGETPAWSDGRMQGFKMP